MEEEGENMLTENADREAENSTIAANSSGENIGEPKVSKSYKNDLIISHDRFLLYRNTEVQTNESENSVAVTWKTKRNIHLDMDPWDYYIDKNTTNRLNDLKFHELQNFIQENNSVTEAMGLSVQGILNVSENLESDGGTLVVPGFHKFHKKYFDVNSIGAIVQKDKRFSVPEFDPLQKLAQRVPMKAGSLLVWDQRVIHGANPNKSKNCRFGIPVRCFRRAVLEKSEERLEIRAERLLTEFSKNGFDIYSDLTETGAEVFGFRGTQAYAEALAKNKYKCRK